MVEWKQGWSNFKTWAVDWRHNKCLSTMPDPCLYGANESFDLARSWNGILRLVEMALPMGGDRLSLF